MSTPVDKLRVSRPKSISGILSDSRLAVSTAMSALDAPTRGLLILAGGAGFCLIVALWTIILPVAGAPTVSSMTFAIFMCGFSLLGWGAARSGYSAYSCFTATAIFFALASGLVATKIPAMAAIAALALLVAYLTGTKEKTGKGESLPTAHDEVAHPGQIKAPCVLLSRDSTVLHCDQPGPLSIAQGERFVSRVHLNDQVLFLRTLMDVAEARLNETAIRIRLNIAPSDKTASYAPTDIRISASATGLHVEWTPPCTVAQTAKYNGMEAGAPEPTMTAPPMLAVVTHELRTPLNAIIGFSDMLRNPKLGGVTTKKQQEYIDLIHNAGTDLLALVTSLLDVSRLEYGSYDVHRENFDLRATVDDAAALIMPKVHHKSIHMVYRLPDESTRVHADRRAIKQILLNLLSNAVKFTPERGSVEVEVSLRADKGCVLSVSDTGIGMSAKDVERACQPFHRADSSYTRETEGTGLGLSLVSGLAALHGGGVHIESNPDFGTVVTVTIPGPSPLEVAGIDQGAFSNPRAGDEVDTIFQRKAG